MIDSAPTRPAPRSGVILRNIMHIGMGQAVSTALGFVLTAALARTLGPADFGLYIIVLSIAGFVYVFVDWGQASYVVARVAREESDMPGFLGTALLVKAVGTLVATVMAAVIALAFGYQPGVALLAPLFVILGLPGGLAQTLGFVFRGKNQMGTEALVANLGKAAGLVAALLALYSGGRVFEVVLASGVGALGWFIAAAICIRRARISIGAPTFADLKHQVSIGAPLAWSALVFALHPLINVWILTRLSAPEVVGWYGAAGSVFGLFVIPSGLLAAASFPMLARAAHKPEELSHILRTNVRLLLLLGAFTASLFYFFADLLVMMVYGRGQFEKTAQLLRASLLFLPLLAVGNLLGSAMAVVGRMSEVAMAKIVFIIATTVISWFLIGYCQERFGNGALAIVYVAGIAEIWMLICFAYLLPPGVEVGAIALDVLRAICVGVLTLLVLWVLQPLTLWLVPPVCIALFASLAWGFGLVGQRELDQVQRLVLKRNLQHEAPRP
jgi:O-antigen/teichoic acid export membrane protein